MSKLSINISIRKSQHDPLSEKKTGINQGKTVATLKTEKSRII